MLLSALKLFNIQIKLKICPSLAMIQWSDDEDFLAY